MRKVAVICGSIEALALLVFGIFILVTQSEETGVRGSSPHPLILLAVYVIFALGVLAVTYALANRKDWAKTPFGLIQVFALLVFAYLPISGSGTLARLAGIAVAVISGSALIALLRINKTSEPKSN